MSLTDLMCKKAQPKEKQYRLSDSHGLSLIITTKGQKYWNVRYTVHGQRQSESLGPYPDLSLKKAREMAYELKYKHSKSVLHEDIKPFFEEVAEDWFENQKETWSPKHISNVRASLDELYIALANKRINQIQALEILQIIKEIETRGSFEIAKRTLSRCGMVMKYAIAYGYRYDNPAGDLVYALKNKRVKNLASLTASEMPEFLKKVRAYPSDAQTHHAIILIMLTGVRVSELLQARWEEFDLEGRKWDIPEERMKNRLPHRVPLTDMMIAEFQALRLTHNQELLFPYCLDNREPMRSESILAVIKRSGYAGRMTTHGFRSLFSTVVNETNLFNPDAIERQLAHVPQNRIRSAYNTLAIALRGQSSSTGVVKVPHSTKFDAGKVKQQLGISVRAWEEHMYEMKSLTQRKVTQIEAKAYFDVVFDNNSLCPIQQDEGIIQFYRNIATQVNSATKAEKKTEPNMDVPCLKS